MTSCDELRLEKHQKTRLELRCAAPKTRLKEANYLSLLVDGIKFETRWISA